MEYANILYNNLFPWHFAFLYFANIFSLAQLFSLALLLFCFLSCDLTVVVVGVHGKQRTKAEF